MAKLKYEIGYKFITNSGEDCEVIGRTGRKVIVKFLKTGWTTECYSNAIKSGNLQYGGDIVYPNTGDILPSRNCGKFRIVEQLGKINYTVKFLDTGYEREVSISNIRSDQIKDPFHPSKYSVGYLGGVIQDKRSYSKWEGIISRCYNKKNQRYKTYGERGVTVSLEWHNYQNFHKWWVDNKPENPQWHLDKDLKSPGNMVYSPDTCLFLPQSINSCLSNLRTPYIIRTTTKGFKLIYSSRYNKKVVYSNDLQELVKLWCKYMKETLLYLAIDNDLGEDYLNYIDAFVENKWNIHKDRQEDSLVFTY